MPKTSLGIQLTAGEALAVRVRSGWKGNVVDLIERIDVGASAAQGAVRPSSLGSDVIVTAMPADAVFHRQVEVPFTNLGKIEQTAPLEAEDSLPLPLESLVCHVQVLERGKQSTQVLVAAAPVDRVRRLLEETRARWGQPRAVDVEAFALGTVALRSLPPTETALVLDLSRRLCQAVWVDQGRLTTFHAFSSAASSEALIDEVSRFLAARNRDSRGAAAVYLAGPESLVADLGVWRSSLGAPASHLPFPKRGVQVGAGVQLSWPAWAVPLGLALRGLAPKNASQVNLLRGPLAPDRGQAPWRRLAAAAGAYAAVLIALWGAGTWAAIAHKQAQYDAVQSAVRSISREALPGVRNVVNEVGQVRERLLALEEEEKTLGSLVDPERSPLRILRDLSSKIPRDVDVEFRELAVEDGKVRIEGTTTSYQASDRIKTQIIESQPRIASVSTEARDGSKPGEVVFRLSANLRERP